MTSQERGHHEVADLLSRFKLRGTSEEEDSHVPGGPVGSSVEVVREEDV